MMENFHRIVSHQVGSPLVNLSYPPELQNFRLPFREVRVGDG
jgi:hypothetical protein